jgi:DnaK suppressor protein
MHHFSVALRARTVGPALKPGRMARGVCVLYSLIFTRDHGECSLNVDADEAGALMAKVISGLDAAFIEKQREALSRLRKALVSAAQEGEADEATLNAESAGRPREYEEDAQKLAALELDGNLVVHNVSRLARVDRAIEKINAGTYGLSDVSGQPIPRERLEAVPDAICTLAEESTFEQGA